MDDSIPKDVPLHVEKAMSDELVENGTPELQLDPKLDRQTVRKLDMLLIPMMCMIYLLAFLDRSNIGNARIAGMQKDLGITDHQYQTGMDADSHRRARC